MDYADIIIDEIDKRKVISYRLYRQHITKYKGIQIKDLSLIGRDLHKTIIVDNLKENFIKQEENGIFIESFFGQDTDRYLVYLSEELKKLAQSKPYDVRSYLPKLRSKLKNKNMNSQQSVNNIVIKIQDRNILNK